MGNMGSGMTSGVGGGMQQQNPMGGMGMGGGMQQQNPMGGMGMGGMQGN